MNKLKIINLIASPGSGKSTCAANVYAKLKQKNYNVELVTEFCKQAVYEGRDKIFSNQLYLLAKQHKRLCDIANYGKVPLVITDSPLVLSYYYGKNLPYYTTLIELVDALNEEFDNFDVFINRVKLYNPSGRNQNEKESQEISQWLQNTLNFDYTINGDEAGANQLVEKIEEMLKDV